MSVSEHIAFVVNGTPRELDVEPRRLLVQALREDLDLTGTHVGCDTSQCGACTVHVDGRAIKSCTMLAVQADGAEIKTIEGLADGDELHPMQTAFWEKHGLQCGFCTPGMIMTAVDLLDAQPGPDRRRDPARHRGQLLPLHRLPEHRRRDPPRRRDHAVRRGRRPRRARRHEMTTEAIPTSWAQRIKRVEDPRFITGAGNYVDDIKLASMAHMAILRSPYAHANIRSIDTSAAKAMPGVVAVFVGADIPYNPMPMAWPAGGSAGIQNNVNTPRTLATDSVKWTGEGVAAVVAETEAQAFDALEAIVVDYEPLPAVVDAEKAIEPGAPQLHENAPNNVVFEWSVGDKAGTDAAIDGAEVVVRQRIVNQRLIPNPMEVRGDIGWYNPGTDEYTIWMSSQTPHIQRLLLAAFVMGIPEHKIRCISPDVGGAFGTKIFCYPDYALVLFASKALGGRPVKWIESRRENYQSTIHGRDHITYLEIAGTRDGEITGLRVKTLANLGGRLSTIGPGIPTTLYARVLSRLLQDPERLRRGHRRLHQHDVRRRLPRRRPARGDLRHRAGDGPVRGRDRDGPRRAPAPELHPAGPVPVREPVRARDRVGRRQDLHRLGQLRAGHGQGARDGRLRRHATRPRRRPRPAASTSASASRPTSRSAASRRPSGSARSARAGAPRCGNRPTSRCT